MTSEPPVDDSFLINQFYLDGSYIPYRFNRTNCGRITILCAILSKTVSLEIKKPDKLFLQSDRYK